MKFGLTQSRWVHSRDFLFCVVGFAELMNVSLSFNLTLLLNNYIDTNFLIIKNYTLCKLVLAPPHNPGPPTKKGVNNPQPPARKQELRVKVFFLNNEKFLFFLFNNPDQILLIFSVIWFIQISWFTVILLVELYNLQHPIQDVEKEEKC